MAIASPILDGFHRFNAAYQQGLADTASEDLESFFLTNPAHKLTREEVGPRYEPVEAAATRISTVQPMPRESFIAFWNDKAGSATFQARLTRMGMSRALTQGFITLTRQVFTSLSPELNEIVARLSKRVAKNTIELQALIDITSLQLVSVESDHSVNDLQAPTGIEFDRESALRLRGFKFYITDITGLRLI